MVQQKWFPKNVTQFVKLFQNLFICYSFFLSKMTAQLRNDFFVCVDNFAKERERDHKQRTPGEGLTHKYNPHILADPGKICLIF